MNYEEFLHSKISKQRSEGIIVAPDNAHPMLFAFQRDLVAWAARKGRAAI